MSCDLQVFTGKRIYLIDHPQFCPEKVNRRFVCVQVYRGWNKQPYYCTKQSVCSMILNCTEPLLRPGWRQYL